jgi:hypothetical protein
VTYSKRELILQEVATRLGNVSAVNGRVYRSRMEAFSRNEAPAIVVEPGLDNAAPEPVSTCKIDWTLSLIVAVYTRGTIPDQLADPIISDLHGRLLADRTLGGLVMDIWPASMDPQFAAADQAAGWYVLTYTVRYRTAVEDLKT